MCFFAFPVSSSKLWVRLKPLFGLFSDLPSAATLSLKNKRLPAYFTTTAVSYFPSSFVLSLDCNSNTEWYTWPLCTKFHLCSITSSSSHFRDRAGWLREYREISTTEARFNMAAPYVLLSPATSTQKPQDYLSKLTKTAGISVCLLVKRDVDGTVVALELLPEQEAVIDL